MRVYPGDILGRQWCWARVAEQAVVHVQIGLGADGCIGVCLVPVAEEIKREHYGPVGRVLERNDAICRCARLHG